jgi:hypothetical protein
MQERETNHMLLYLACEHICLEWDYSEGRIRLENPREWWTRAREVMEEMCMGFLHGVRHLTPEDLCIGVRQLPMDGCYASKLDNSQCINLVGIK